MLLQVKKNPHGAADIATRELLEQPWRPRRSQGVWDLVRGESARALAVTTPVYGEETQQLCHFGCKTFAVLTNALFVLHRCTILVLQKCLRVFQALFVYQRAVPGVVCVSG